MPKAKVIAIATGGTGGHVLPAERVGGLLDPFAKVIYMGVNLSKNPYFIGKKKEIYDVKGANFSKGKLSGLVQIGCGFVKAAFLLARKKVDHVVGFGSFYSLPILLAAKFLRIPYTLYSPDILPGKVNRLFSRWARQTVVLFPESTKHLKGETACLSPFFDSSEKGMCEKEARLFFGLDPDLATILVFGGSKGSSEINAFLLEKRELLRGKCQIIHLTGESSITKEMYESYGIKAYVAPYSHAMREAWSASTFAIARAGAGTLREMIVYERPALLIPYPHSSENHQERNAEFMHQVVGGGVHASSLEEMTKALEELFDQEKYEEKRSALSRYAKRGSLEDFQTVFKGIAK